tara:strand:+ start:103 stop:303 length:201 start_codon:yes stop_codon:yes gene_type:complete
MKTIKTLKETTDYWKALPIGTVIAMPRDEDVGAIIKNGDGELVGHPDSATATEQHHRTLDKRRKGS